MGPDKDVKEDESDQAGTDSKSPGPFQPLAEIEKVHVLKVLKECGGNKKQTAEVLGIDRSTLYAKLRAYGHIGDGTKTV